MLATMILFNGRFYTGDPQMPFCSAAAIRGNRIFALGNDADLLALSEPDGKTINLGGRTVLPGLVDAHVHFQGYARTLGWLSLFPADSLADAKVRTAEFASQLPQGEWLQGIGWSAYWPDTPGSGFPTAAMLDQIVPDRPVFLRDKSTHAAWVNSYTLQLAGIDASTPDPEGGEIQRDTAGRPTGILFEAAMDLIRHCIPRATTEQLAAKMEAAQMRCWELGLTGLHDFDGSACFRALQLLRNEQKLGLRVVKNIPAKRLTHAVELGLRSGFGDHWLRIGGIKQFADGALGPRTAAMLAPYEGEPDNRGIVVTDKEEMAAIVDQASANGLSSTIHAIGDRANHDVLDVYEWVRGREAAEGRASLRHRIEHVQIIHPEDLPRLAQLNLIASMQPIHALADMEMADRFWGSRAALSYALRAVKDSGAAVAFSSDAPIESIDPLKGIRAAVTRRRDDGMPGVDGWYPEQRLTVAEAVAGFTMGAAYAAGTEQETGSMTVGKLADFTILNGDIFQATADLLGEVRVAGTIVDGRWRYRAF